MRVRPPNIWTKLPVSSNMKRYLSALTYLFFFTQFTFAQILPDFIPDDVGTAKPSIKCFCKPGLDNTSRSRGLTVSYGINTSGDYTEEGTPLESPFTTYDGLNKLLLDLKVPIVNKDDLKVLLTYQYVREVYDFGTIGNDFTAVFKGLNGEILKGNDYGLIISKSVDENKYLGFYGKYSTKGNYQKWTNFNAKYAIYKARLFFGKKPNINTEWGVGLSFTKGFRNTNLLPFVIYNKNFSNKWGFESVLPAYAYMRYNWNKNNIFLGGFQFSGQSYRVDLENEVFPNAPFDYSLNHTELRITTIWEKKIIPWIWAEAQIGYQFNFSTEFAGKNEVSPTFDADPSNSIFLKMGIFLSPPDDFMK